MVFLRALFITGADVSKYHRSGGLNNSTVSPTVWRPEGRGHGVGRAASCWGCDGGSVSGPSPRLDHFYLLPESLHAISLCACRSVSKLPLVLTAPVTLG